MLASDFAHRFYGSWTEDSLKALHFDANEIAIKDLMNKLFSLLMFDEMKATKD